MSDAEAESDADVPSRAKWERLPRRSRAWEAWARAGVLVWVAQRPHLRRLPLPWPGCQGVGDYVSLQPGAPRVPSAVLVELMELRRHLGNAAAFVQSDRVSAALRVA